MQARPDKTSGALVAAARPDALEIGAREDERLTSPIRQLPPALPSRGVRALLLPPACGAAASVR